MPSNEGVAENIGLLSGQASPRSNPNSRWGHWIRDFVHASKITLGQSYINSLLFCVPLGLVAGAQGWNPSAVFLINFVALFPLSSLLAFSTEELAKSVGQMVGGLVNATFGNALEMIVGITAVSQGEIRIVQSSMVGSILSGMLLILGCCFFFGGYNKETLVFNLDVVGVMTSLMIVSSAVLIIPSALSSMTPWKLPEVDRCILHLSRVASIVLLIFYIVYLYFQLKSHADLFNNANDGPEEDNEVQLGPWAASIVLILATLGVTFCSDALVDGVDGFVETWHISRAFIGLIIVPIVGNAGEFTTTVKAAIAGKMDLAIGVIVGATLQIALFVTPFLVLCGWIIGQPMSLHFSTFETTILAFTVIVVTCLIREGRSNYLEGLLLIGTYSIVAVAFYVYPEGVGGLLVE